MTLDGRNALVTGGGRGIGRAISLALAEDGANVAVNYRRDKDAADEVVAEIKGMGAVITRTDKLGTYKLPGFGKNITPNRVSISCSKDGYKQIRTLTRPPRDKKAATVEVECTMQQVGAK